MARDDPSRDAALIRRFRDGDGDALGALFDRYERLLQARAQRWLPARLERKVSIADVIQETRIIAFDRRRDFVGDGGDQFRNWLLGIVENRARKAVRHHAGAAKRDAFREVSRGQRPDTARLPGAEASPSQHAMAAELMELARRALSALPDDYRRILQLTREEHVSLAEAARRMGRTREAAKRLRSRALLRFTDEFRKLRGSDDDG